MILIGLHLGILCFFNKNPSKSGFGESTSGFDEGGTSGFDEGASGFDGGTFGLGAKMAFVRILIKKTEFRSESITFLILMLSLGTSALDLRDGSFSITGESPRVELLRHLTFRVSLIFVTFQEVQQCVMGQQN